ncbi:methionine--tRNA ligase [Candidatus Woesearchaeota archaeon]|nr:methionine--tRNA ligase [Candidatus Woesearchaeota archaeon]
MAKKTFYITTAIDYVNAKPHCGHLYEKAIADAIARWHRLLGEDVFFLTGTDDNASKNEEAAEKAGIPVREFVDKNAQFFIELCKKANLSNDDFIRTVEKRHVKVVQELFKKAFDNGDIYKGHYEGLYCKGCEAFYTEKDLINGECPEHKKKPEHIKEESYFFKLSKFKEKILELIKKGLITPQTWSNEIQSRLEKEELKDISVSRVGKTWGIKTPIDQNHTVYVWFDALGNYYSATRIKSKEKFWPANVHFIGKGINWFHSVIWPGMLYSLGIEQPKKVLVHGYLTFEGQKMSKSLGNVIDPIYLIDTYGVDQVRYYLMRDIPAGQDGDVSEKSIVERANADLANSLGNLLQRVNTLVFKNFDGKIPKPGKFEKDDEELIQKANTLFTRANEQMQNYEWSKALEIIWEFIHECNAYINKTEPWKVQDKKRLGTILYVLVESLRITSLLTYSFIPESSEKLAKQIGQKIKSFKDATFKKTTKGKTEEPQILFKKVEFVERKEKIPEIELVISPEVKNLGIKVVGTQINDLKIRKKSETIEKMKKDLKENLQKYENKEVLEEYNKIQEKAGLDKEKNPNSVVGLIKLIKGNNLPQINAVVDVYNIVSVKTLTSIATHDVNRLVGKITVRLSKEGEEFISLEGNRELLKAGELVYSDEEKIIGRLSKQCNQTKTEITTKHVFLILFGNNKMSDNQMQDALKEAKELIIGFNGKEVQQNTNQNTSKSLSLLNLKVAQIESVEDHPNADKLYFLKLDLGGEKRQLVGGIKNSYKKEELVGKKIVIISNLKPANIRGIESQGMLLAAEKEGVVKVLEPQGNPGDQVQIEGTTPNNNQITIEDFAKLKLEVKNKKAYCDGKELKGVSIDLPDGAKIK